MTCTAPPPHQSWHCHRLLLSCVWTVMFMLASTSSPSMTVVGVRVHTPMPSYVHHSVNNYNKCQLGANTEESSDTTDEDNDSSEGDNDNMKKSFDCLSDDESVDTYDNNVDSGVPRATSTDEFENEEALLKNDNPCELLHAATSLRRQTGNGCGLQMAMAGSTDYCSQGKDKKTDSSKRNVESLRQQWESMTDEKNRVSSETERVKSQTPSTFTSRLSLAATPTTPSASSASGLSLRTAPTNIGMYSEAKRRPSSFIHEGSPTRATPSRSGHSYSESSSSKSPQRSTNIGRTNCGVKQSSPTRSSFLSDSIMSPTTSSSYIPKYQPYYAKVVGHTGYDTVDHAAVMSEGGQLKGPVVSRVKQHPNVTFQTKRTTFPSEQHVTLTDTRRDPFEYLEKRDTRTTTKVFEEKRGVPFHHANPFAKHGSSHLTNQQTYEFLSDHNLGHVYKHAKKQDTLPSQNDVGHGFSESFARPGIWPSSPQVDNQYSLLARRSKLAPVGGTSSMPPKGSGGPSNTQAAVKPKRSTDSARDAFFSELQYPNTQASSFSE